MRSTSPISLTPETRGWLRLEVDRRKRERLEAEGSYVESPSTRKALFLLSTAQREVLRQVYALDQEREGYNSMTGVRWQAPSSTPSLRASSSRTLRRLEHRGFLLRLNKQGDVVTRSGGKTRYVLLTLEGRTAGGMLTG